MNTANKLMNIIFRRAAGHQVEGSNSEMPARITEAQGDRIVHYMELGASYQEARDLVLNYRPSGGSAPAGNAGAGTGKEPPIGEVDMNNFIRRASGR